MHFVYFREVFDNNVCRWGRFSRDTNRCVWPIRYGLCHRVPSKYVPLL